MYLYPFVRKKIYVVFYDTKISLAQINYRLSKKVSRQEEADKRLKKTKSEYRKVRELGENRMKDIIARDEKMIKVRCHIVILIIITIVMISITLSILIISIIVTIAISTIIG